QSGTRIGSPPAGPSSSYFGHSASLKRRPPISTGPVDFRPSPSVFGGSLDFEQAATPTQSGTNSNRRTRRRDMAMSSNEVPAVWVGGGFAEPTDSSMVGSEDSTHPTETASSSQNANTTCL